MKNLPRFAAAAAALALVSCTAGPHQLKRTVDDWDHQLYVKNPLLNGVLHFVPVIPLAAFGASVGDFFIVDAYHFWFKDAWDGKGTAFVHAPVKPMDGAVESLLIDGAKFVTKHD